MSSFRDQVAYRLKAIVLAAGLAGIGVLEWAATSPEVAQGLEQLVPPAFVPLVPLVLGGIGTLFAVHQTTNTPLPASEPAATVAELQPVQRTDLEGSGGVAVPAVAPEQAAGADNTPPAASAATPAAPEDAPFWSGVPTGAPTTSTSIIKLQPVPTRDYQ